MAKPNILIIDDDEQIRGLLKDVLNPNNDCTTVGSAEGALSILQSINFNLVISDINMGGISGLVWFPGFWKKLCSMDCVEVWFVHLGGGFDLPSKMNRTIETVPQTSPSDTQIRQRMHAMQRMHVDFS